MGALPTLCTGRSLMPEPHSWDRKMFWGACAGWGCLPTLHPHQWQGSPMGYF